MKTFLLLFVSMSMISPAPAQNAVCLPSDGTHYGFSFPEDTVNKFLNLGKYKAVFFGEQHNDGFTPEIKYNLIVDLNRHYGYRHIFIEAGSSSAWLINRYLKDGDTTDFHPYGGYTLFYRRLYEYNRSLPDDTKLVVHGVDFERTGVFRVIHLLAPPGKPVPAVLQPAMDTVRTHIADTVLRMYSMANGRMTLYDNSPFENRLRYLQGEFSRYSAEAKAFFGDNYSALDDIVQNEGRVIVMPKPRNKTMYRNMGKIVKKEQIDKFIGFFGSEHTKFSVSSSLTNRASGLPGFGTNDILNIVSVVYNRSGEDGTAMKFKDVERLKELNGGCKATIMRTQDVPGYRDKADYVIIADGK
jgi:hypothetical protein